LALAKVWVKFLGILGAEYEQSEALSQVVAVAAVVGLLIVAVERKIVAAAVVGAKIVEAEVAESIVVVGVAAVGVVEHVEQPAA
jgi:hypothetical protein